MLSHPLLLLCNAVTTIDGACCCCYMRAVGFDAAVYRIMLNSLTPKCVYAGRFVKALKYIMY
jgi:hypothetical protein